MSNICNICHSEGQYFIKICEEKIGRKVSSGEFAADMKVSLINDGPVTIVIDSKVKD